MSKLEPSWHPEPTGTRSLGTVMAVQANFYRVHLDSLKQADRPWLLCTRRTRLKKIGQQVMVGDRVWVERADLDSERGAIAEVLPRKSVLDRPPVANADQLLLLFALEEPHLDVWQLSRFLVKAETTEIALGLCLNKCDLIDIGLQKDWQHRLEDWGYLPYFVSIKAGAGVEELLVGLQDKTTILAGPSGVGKSSLINCLVPQGEQRVNAVSGKLQKGRHTTRHVELFPLPKGGFVADTPGFNQPDLDVLPEMLMQYFPEIMRRKAIASCQFNDCWHRDEPNCEVRGEWERYDHYLKLLEEAIAQSTSLQQTPDQESSLKLKIREAGMQDYEPKLASKKYRRSSRRSRQQDLQEQVENLSLSDLTQQDWDGE